MGIGEGYSPNCKHGNLKNSCPQCNKPEGKDGSDEGSESVEIDPKIIEDTIEEESSDSKWVDGPIEKVSRAIDRARNSEDSTYESSLGLDKPYDGLSVEELKALKSELEERLDREDDANESSTKSSEIGETTESEETEIDEDDLGEHGVSKDERDRFINYFKSVYSGESRGPGGGAGRPRESILNTFLDGAIQGEGLVDDEMYSDWTRKDFASAAMEMVNSLEDLIEEGETKGEDADILLEELSGKIEQLRDLLK